jgi:hypothetical protein
MKLGQFVCLGNLQRLKNRFGHGYSAQVKVPMNTITKFNDELILGLPGIEIEGKDLLSSKICIYNYIHKTRTTQWNVLLHCTNFLKNEQPEHFDTFI